MPHRGVLTISHPLSGTCIKQNVYPCHPDKSERRRSEGAWKDPENFPIHAASGSSHNTSSALRHDPSSWFSYTQLFFSMPPRAPDALHPASTQVSGHEFLSS